MAQAVDITGILQSAQSADANVRTQAEAQLKQFEQQNYASYLFSLATELAHKDKPAESRQIAGLILKNTLDAPDEVKKAELAAKWLNLDPNLKQQIRQALLATLGSEVQVARHTDALVIAKLAAIELPNQQWPDLIPHLLQNMSAQPPNSALRQSTLETLGYVCEEMGNLKEDVLEQEQVNSILTAVVQGMRKDEPDGGVRLAATTALLNALEFAHTNFENDAERNYLMQVICEGTMSPDTKIREASFECLVKIAANYYERLPPYMSDIFRLTHRSVTEDEEDVAKQAIEFWCTICEEEIALQEEINEGDSSVVNHHFVRQAMSPLVTLLLDQLTKQEEGQDRDDTTWNLSMAAGACLGLVAQAAENEVVPLVMPYVQKNIGMNNSPEDWRWREAATFAFGSILEGPTVDTLSQLVQTGLSFLLNAMKDANSQVRHTTAWTIGRIFEFVHGADPTAPIITNQNLTDIVTVLLAAIKDEPHISEKVCYALSQLAAGFRDAEGTSPLSPYFKDVVQALLETAERAQEAHADSTRLSVQTGAFEALNEVVRSASVDTLALVAQLIPLMLTKLGQTFQMANTSPDALERQSELQGQVCGVLQVIIQKLSETDASKAAVLQYADPIMQALLSVFACRNATTHEEAMLAVGALTYACGKQFVKYMERFFPVLEQGLQRHQDWQVCSVTVGVLGDVSRAIEDQIAPFCDRIMQVLLTNLQSNDVHRNIKPQILSSFGDLALAIGDKYEPYLPHVLPMLASAQQLSLAQQQANDPDFYEYNNMLRSAIFEAYSGLFNGLSREKCDAALKPYTPGVLEFVEYVWNDKANADEVVTKAALALLGDVAATISGVGPLFQAKPYVQSMLAEARQSADDILRETAEWASAAVSKALQTRV